MFINEDFIIFLWNYQVFDKTKLKTTTGEQITIIKIGSPNNDSGADFFNSKIQIGETIWAGNIEIHVNSSDWYSHKHNIDKSYNNVILHVVYNHDKDVIIDNRTLPVIELKNRINASLISKYYVFKSSPKNIPCQNEINTIPSIYITKWLETLSIERLEEKTNQILQSLQSKNYDFEEVFYQKIAYGFGLKINSEMMEILANSIPLKNLNKQSYNLLQIEAILFGQAGFLNEIEPTNQYILKLKEEYKFLQNKYNLTPFDKKIWKYSKLRPTSFPEIKIALLAKLIFQNQNLFSAFTEEKNIENIKNKLAIIEVSEYWKTDFRIEKQTISTNKHLGENTINIIIINVIIPFIFAYGKTKNEIKYIDKAIEFLNNIKAEQNNIIEKFNKIGIKSNNAADSQAIIQLFNKYCKNKQCLKCSIGQHLLKE
ncbi:MAG: hypothetical protein A2X12_00520 [Bacteroidetes bacterium GWE2_29_8]|nr:MAG: hypothetical protein A2X12_00520 [Bacteroidetes bacterium GWE2_29_8]